MTRSPILQACGLGLCRGYSAVIVGPSSCTRSSTSLLDHSRPVTGPARLSALAEAVVNLALVAHGRVLYGDWHPIRSWCTLPIRGCRSLTTGCKQGFPEQSKSDIKCDSKIRIGLEGSDHSTPKRASLAAVLLVVSSLCRSCGVRRTDIPWWALQTCKPPSCAAGHQCNSINTCAVTSADVIFGNNVLDAPFGEIVRARRLSFGRI